MKCKIFYDEAFVAQDLFNKWAKGKALAKDVIIHTQVTERIESCETTSPRLLIIVFHPEGQQWDATHLTAPVHQEPEPHVKVEEMKVTA
jgi:hypothetical protein